MKKAGFLLFLCVLPVFCFAQAPVSLDKALQNGAAYLSGRLPRNTRLSVLAVESESPELSDYVLKNLGVVLVNDGYFTVIERDAAALSALSREMNYQLSGEVSDETSLSIGKQLGVEIILTGAIQPSGGTYRLDLKAVAVESAQIRAQWSAERIRPDASWGGLVKTSSTAALSFAGEVLSERDKQVFANALDQALKAQKIPLNIDLSTTAAAYTFTLSFYSEDAPPVPPANTALLKGELSLVLNRGSQALRRAGPYTVTELSLPLLVRRAAEELQKDRAFFMALASIINP
ncbi:MAG: CsgG/HfaB family protein [Treponema sp.]|jgi:hypothetical protein|nr:CsgG/HfaB family protein [Treponema sp.]